MAYPFDNLEDFFFPDPSSSGINISGDWQIVTIPPYVPPAIEDISIGAEPPGVPDITMDSVDGIYKAPDGTISPLDLPGAPENTAKKPSIYIGQQPGDFTGTAPGDAPTVDDVDIPDLPINIDDIPGPPGITDVVIPPFDGIVIPGFEGEAPTNDIIIPESDFVFDETPYSSEVLNTVTSEIVRMLGGGVGIPEAVWQQIFEKGADQEEGAANKLIEETTNEFASRGWSAPGGVLDKRIREARQTIQNARNSLARDVTIKRAEAELENLKYAVAQGIVLEQMLVALHNATYDRALKAAEVDMQIKIQIINARVAVLNADLAIYQTTADVYKTLIESEMLKIEAYKAELEGLSLTVEVDRIKIQAYSEQIKSLSLIIDMHNAQIEGLKTAVDIDRIRVDAYAKTVSAYTEKIRAWGLEWEGYKTSIDAQGLKVDIYAKEIDAFTSESGAYETRVRAESVRIDADAKIIETNIERMKADASRFSAESDYEIGKVGATADIYKTQMQGYQTKAAFVSNQVQAYSVKTGAHIENAKAAANTNVESARIWAAQYDAIGRANVSLSETTARIEAQIAAAQLGRENWTYGQRASWSEVHTYDETA